MTDRRPLVDGLKPPTPAVDRAAEQAFVYGSKPTAAAGDPPPGQSVRSTPPVARSPVTTRIRADFAAALKRASLERQLSGTVPNTLQEILEEALEPWLKQHGYVP